MPTTLSAIARALPAATITPGATPGVDPGATVVVDAVHDSRTVTPGVLFCALPGANVDGHEHAADAVARGAVAVLTERSLDLPVPQLQVPSTRAVLGPVAAAVHGHPSSACAVVGVTGTNGKTTTVALVEAAAAAAGLGTGVVGTTGARVHGSPVPNERTTPEATDLQRLLRSFVDRGVEVAAVEVSSHGLALHRIDGTRLRVAGFTMLGDDHLDFHGDRDSYLAAKQRLFAGELAEAGVVVVDDDAGRAVAAGAAVPVRTLSTTGGAADHRLVDIQLDVHGGRGVLEHRDGTRVELTTQLLGHHNLANAALAVLLAEQAGVPLDAALAGVAACPGVVGRLERVAASGIAGAPVVLVDYAHTPDAIRTVVAGLRSLLPPGGRLAVVVGAGGDRDTAKRPSMGAAAAAADLAVLTSDNPRSEDPVAIVEAVALGARDAAGAGTELLTEPDRRRAIAAALAWAGADDVVLVAGKGHETGQVFADRVEPFDDRVVATELLRERADAP